ncbi:MAG: IS110 family transposase [Actinomycetota bacterium]|nr:IS110 family transposase [Actinomycetota bacterium]
MEKLYPHCAGSDVHKKTAVVSVSWLDEQGRQQKQTRTFSTMTADLRRLRDWLAERRVTHVARESTGVYWRPIFNLLEEQFTVILAHAAQVKAVPGRKTDVRDSEWLLELMQQGLIRGSFIPPAAIRELRDLTRYRTSLIQERAREVNRVQKVLEDANIKLGAVASDTLGASGRPMIEALIAGETNPGTLADLAKGQLRRKRALLQQALDGRVCAHHRLLLRELLAHISYLDQAIARVSDEIAERTGPFAAAIELLRSIPGIQQRAAEVILAEIGADLSHFPSARHLCSWPAVCPGNRESGGKRLSGRTRSGNRWLRAVLLQVAWAAARVKGGYFGAQFRRIAKRRGEKRAALAVAHSILTVIYHLLTDGVLYEDLGAAYFDQLAPDKVARYHPRRLAELGYEVTLVPTPAA